MPYGAPGQCQTNTCSISEGPSQFCSPSKFTVAPTAIDWNCVATNSIWSKRKHVNITIQESSLFTNAFLHWREWALPWQTVFLIKQHFVRVCGKVNRHSWVCGSENPRDVTEYERDSPKVNVWCLLMRNKVICPFLKNLQWLVTLFWPWQRTMLYSMPLWE
jgi:hypothetical protein